MPVLLLLLLLLLLALAKSRITKVRMRDVLRTHVVPLPPPLRFSHLPIFRPIFFFSWRDISCHSCSCRRWL
jgi:hypothetical protein